MKKRSKEGRMELPAQGAKPEEILAELQEMREGDADWRNGKAFCLVYYPGEKYGQAIRDAYNLFMSENALNPTAFPSLRQMENEVIGMTANLLNGPKTAAGSMTSGGTESILLAVKTARRWGEQQGIHEPEIILPSTAHPAFQKACYYFGVKARVVRVGPDFRVDPTHVAARICRNTVMIVGSAPSYPHGVIDPITELGKVAQSAEVLFHVDACIGGFMLPFLPPNGYKIPDWDFRVPGVTSISVDLHKYGYASKGASALIHRTPELRKNQYYVYSEWQGGIYASTTMLGTRPGGAIAAAWAALKVIGYDGYVKLASDAMYATGQIRKEIERSRKFRILGDPDMTILSIGSDRYDMHQVADELAVRGWVFDRLQNPSAIHLTIQPMHMLNWQDFLSDFRKAEQKVSGFHISSLTTSTKLVAIKALRNILTENAFNRLRETLSGAGQITRGRTAATYGMMATFAASGDLDEIVLDFLDKLHTI